MIIAATAVRQCLIVISKSVDRRAATSNVILYCYFYTNISFSCKNMLVIISVLLKCNGKRYAINTIYICVLILICIHYVNDQ